MFTVYLNEDDGNGVYTQQQEVLALLDKREPSNTSLGLRKGQGMGEVNRGGEGKKQRHQRRTNTRKRRKSSTRSRRKRRRWG